MSQPRPTTCDFGDLFTNIDPEIVWGKAALLLYRISPGFALGPPRAIFNDVVSVFRGEYPGYCAIKTPYHNLSHTLDVFLCSVRLMHGMQLAGKALTEREVLLVMIATLMHDIGYAQLSDGSESGTGAQFTPVHVKRGIGFMRTYLAERNHPPDLADDLEPIISCSDPFLPIANIEFGSARTRLCGQTLGTADLVGQMADRHYLEKLIYLFDEFEEAHMGNYENVHDMLRKSRGFFEVILDKLDSEYDSLYENLENHFLDALGQKRNYYMESIQKNMDYLAKVTAMDESEYFDHLRRGNIIKNHLAGKTK